MRSDLPLTVYFDGSCPMCRSEMLNIRAHDARGYLHPVDCSAPAFDDAPFHRDGIRREDMMTRLHVRDRKGDWIRGSAAMELIYRTVGMQRMARLWAAYALLGRMYPWIARHRQALSMTGIPMVFALWARYASWRAYRRTDGCRAGHCQADAGAATHGITVILEKWLLLLAYGHIVAGVAIPLLAYSGWFDYYSALLQETFWQGAPTPAPAMEFQRWIVALFGPTIASVGVVMAFLVRAGMRSGEAWPWTAILAALAVWGPGDIGISMLRHFWLHVQIDMAILLAIVPPVLILRAQARARQIHPVHHAIKRSTL